MADRVHKTMMNAKVGLVFYFTSIVLAFFSRRIFLECLGDTFIGLSGTIGSILEFLNISEIGIGTCIGYFLYKPIESRDQEKIKEIVSLFGYLYSIVGTVILSGALIISIFLPFVFADKGVSLYLVYSTFFAFLGSQLIGYFLNYRRILIDSDQKTYKLAIWTQSFNICKILAQMALAYHFHSPYIWLAIELGFNLFTCWLINRIVNREYPWLVTDRRRGKEVLKKYPEILVKAKQIVIHRLKNFFLSKSDEILVFAFESLQMVAYYGNYMMIVGKLTALFNSVLTGMNASIGNLVAEGNKWNIRKVFWEYLTFRYWTTGIFIIALAFLVNPLIGWWLGPQYKTVCRSVHQCLWTLRRCLGGLCGRHHQPDRHTGGRLFLRSGRHSPGQDCQHDTDGGHLETLLSLQAGIPGIRIHLLAAYPHTFCHPGRHHCSQLCHYPLSALENRYHPALHVRLCALHPAPYTPALLSHGLPVLSWFP